MSLRNIPAVEIIAVDQLNAYDVVKSDDVVFTKAAYEVFVGETVEVADVASDETEDTKAAKKPADDGPSAKTPYGKGSHAPLKSGKAPKGYNIKGNADSMLYHTPDSQWYEQTTAEVWFDSVVAAEAAGFNAPGGADHDDEAEDTKPEEIDE
jgi:large subunit ribosomal protein L4